ncbi:hypothetical protein [Mesorhizobium sp. M0060]|uniref:hypothetical protein n=1 Tax=Mesorhizobium sp. M0060 TaxID=2956866 RepID=UPI00333C91AE
MLDHITKEWGVLKGAPLAFFILLAIGLSGGFKVGLMWRDQEVADGKALVLLKDGQIDGYQKALSDRLEKVEKQLSENQLSLIRSKIQADPSSVDIIGGHPDKPDPRVDQLKGAFKDSGWNVGASQMQTSTSDLVLRAQDPRAATTIENALKDAGIVYEAVKPLTNGSTDFLLGTGGK